MTIFSSNDPSKHILRRALANRTAGFIGVVSTTDAQRRIPIRLQFSDPALNCQADVTLLDQNLLEHLLVIDAGKRLSAPEVCPFTQGGHCPPYNHLSIILGNEEVGRLALIPSFNSRHSWTPQRRSFPVTAGKRLACLPIEIRLRGKPARQPAGRPIYYVDLTLRSGTTLENTLANARGTASRWFRADRPGQSRLRQRHLRNQIKREARGHGGSPSGGQGHR
jgi:hypothetical protein